MGKDNYDWCMWWLYDSGSSPYWVDKEGTKHSYNKETDLDKFIEDCIK